MGHAMFGSSIKAVLAVELPRLKPPPDTIGGCLARTRSLLFSKTMNSGKKRARVSQRASSGAPQPAPERAADLGADVQKERSSSSSAKQGGQTWLGVEVTPFLQRIFEEQAARNAQSRREAIDDFHRLSGCHNDFQRIEACHLED